MKNGHKIGIERNQRAKRRKEHQAITTGGFMDGLHTVNVFHLVGTILADFEFSAIYGGFDLAFNSNPTIYTLMDAQ